MSTVNLTPYVLNIALDVKEARSAHAVARLRGKTREAVVVNVATAERVIGRRLFYRTPGAGNSDWTPDLEAWEYVRTHPKFGPLMASLERRTA